MESQRLIQDKKIFDLLKDNVNQKQLEYVHAINEFLKFTKIISETSPLNEQRAIWDADMEKKENAGQGLKAEIELDAINDDYWNDERKLKYREKEAQIMTSFVERYRRGAPVEFESGSFSVFQAAVPNLDPEVIKAGAAVVFGTGGDISEEAKKYTIGIDPAVMESGSNVVASGMKVNPIQYKGFEELASIWQQAIDLKKPKKTVEQMINDGELPEV